ncbi:hypothetical protein WDU94_002233, partial [Cyamophila willieti]
MCFNLIVFEITTLHSVKWSKKTLRVNYSKFSFQDLYLLASNPLNFNLFFIFHNKCFVQWYFSSVLSYFIVTS